MADAHDSPDIYWVEPRRRGILPLGGFHLSRSLAKTLRQERFTLTANRAFRDVLAGCAEPAPGRGDTWINAAIIEGYAALFARGNAHSLEVWSREGDLVGGVYGVELGGAFFGESMFSRVTDASKVALAHLVARLRAGGYGLLDTQFLTPHLARFGAIEIGRDPYRALLAEAIARRGDFFAFERDQAAGAGPAATGSAGVGVAEPGLADGRARGATTGGGAIARTVSGPVSGKRIAQFLNQTS